MKKKSAGILMYRFYDTQLQVLLAHPGGPFYHRKDLSVWSVPKGEYTDEESPQAAAVREFREELGLELKGGLIALQPIVQKSGKEVITWAVEGDFNPDSLQSNTFPLEWPPRSGKIQEFPELDRVEWFDLATAKVKIIPGQVPILEELEEKFGAA